MNVIYYGEMFVVMFGGKAVKEYQFRLLTLAISKRLHGGLDYKTKEFITYTAKTANSETTISFLKYLRSQRPGAKLFIIWDGASYHRSQPIKDYLYSLNSQREKEQWLITCERFAPNAPQQNPVEDIWLQAKRLIRGFYFFCHSFSVVKALFELSIHCQTFEFPKLHEYGFFSQMI